jgi:hypothetical protein
MFSQTRATARPESQPGDEQQSDANKSEDQPVLVSIIFLSMYSQLRSFEPLLPPSKLY